VWDFRFDCPQLETGDNDFLFYKRLLPYFKSADWQLEAKPGSGVLHYQGRGSLYKKMREGPTTLEMQQAIGGPQAKGFAAYMKPTSQENLGNAGYQMKADTRVRGPWSLKNPPKEKTPRVQLMEEKGLRPFQQTIVDLMKQPANDRSFYIIYDPKGNAGKSSLLQYLHYYDIAFDLQPFGSVKEMMQYAYGFTHKPGYVLNFPKAVDGYDDRQRHEFAMLMAGLESLKDGRAVDGRNHPRPPIHFPAPNMLLLMNTKFPLGLVAIDRYTFFSVDDNYELKDITEEMLLDYKIKSRDFMHLKEKDRIIKEYQREMKQQKFRQAHAEDASLQEKFRAADIRAGYQLDDNGQRIVGGRHPVELPPRRSPLADLAARSRSPPAPAGSSGDRFMPEPMSEPATFVCESSEEVVSDLEAVPPTGDEVAV
jgi:hypothetical protein